MNWILVVKVIFKNKVHCALRLTQKPVLKSYTILILLLLEVELQLRIPLEVTEYGAEADLREGDLSIYACLSSPFQYKMIRFVQECDQLSPVHHYQKHYFVNLILTKSKCKMIYVWIQSYK